MLDKEPKSQEPINIDTGFTGIQWIYGFPTSGKSTLQRTLRFLNEKQRAALEVKTTLDVTDTDEWLATFKMSQNRSMKNEIRRIITQSMMLASKLKSHHCRIVTTNVWQSLKEAGIRPILICIPQIDEVAKRVKERGDDHPEWIVDQAKEWLDHLVHDPWFEENKGVVRYMGADQHLMDLVTVNSHPVPFIFDRQHAVVDRKTPRV